MIKRASAKTYIKKLGKSNLLNSVQKSPNIVPILEDWSTYQTPRYRNDGSSPIHQSHFNRADKAKILSARFKPVDGRARTLHVYEDGTGTFDKDDVCEYSSTLTQRAWEKLGTLGPS